MSVTLRSDGKAVDVVLSADATKGDLVVAQGWFGVAMNDGVTGDTIAIEVSEREFVFAVDAGLTAAKGDVLYVTSAGALSNTAASNKPALKVTKAKDSNNVIWAKVLPQLSQERSDMKDFNFRNAAAEAERKVLAEMRESGRVVGFEFDSEAVISEMIGTADSAKEFLAKITYDLATGQQSVPLLS